MTQSAEIPPVENPRRGQAGPKNIALIIWVWGAAFSFAELAFILNSDLHTAAVESLEAAIGVISCACAMRVGNALGQRGWTVTFLYPRRKERDQT